MGKGKKLAILLVIAVLLGGGYFAARHFLSDETETPEAEESESVSVGAMTAEDITGIEYLYGKEEIRMVKDGDLWYLESDRNYPLDQAYPTTIAQASAELAAKRLVSESAEDFAEYGLSEPSTAYVFTLKDGKKVTYFIGNYNNYGNSYYMNVSGTEKIYLISGEYLDNFNRGFAALAEIGEIETASTEEVTAMTMTLDGKTTKLFYAPEGLDTVYSRSFTWFADKTTPVDSTAAQDLIGKAVAYSATGCAAYEATAEQISAFGLDKPALTLNVSYTVSEEVETGEKDENDAPITETKTEDKKLTLKVGGQAEDGSFYGQIEGEKAVRLIDPAYMESLRTFDLNTLRSADVCLVRMDDIESMTVTIGGKKSEITITRSDNTEGDSIVYMQDGTQITAVNFNALYSSIQGMVSEGFAAKQTDGKARITVTYKTSVKGFEEMTLQFIPYDQNFYVVDLNGRREVLVNKRDVEAVEQAFNDLQNV